MDKWLINLIQIKADRKGVSFEQALEDYNKDKDLLREHGE
jgi:hypothetical protein